MDDSGIQRVISWAVRFSQRQEGIVPKPVDMQATKEGTFRTGGSIGRAPTKRQ